MVQQTGPSRSAMAPLVAAACGSAALLQVASSSSAWVVGGNALRGSSAAAAQETAVAAQSSPMATAPGQAHGSYAAASGLAVASAAAAGLAAARREKRAGTRTTTGRQARVALQARGGADARIVVIAGPPAAGKGTQCEKIKDKYGFVHISTGDILRANVKDGTELGKKAKEYMDAGKLVPSELIVDLVKDRLAQADIKENGCLLDGFPRAEDQAQAMVDAGIAVSKFIVIKVPDDTLVERGCGRRLDPETGDIYHMKFKPPPADIVERLVHRSDDQEESIRERLRIYHSQVGAITPFFKECVVEIDGTGSPAEVFDLVQGGIDA
eukprot:TRINITY_DN15499_c0_g1_i5.p2 TRINITY_DN15499_c0_g1~~TRINITY_DN15499_c0_g1_i5.p2  ORF type:complete len:325 (-),score=114.27 TRINITY_DN15499_c0_g1_i5:188-1162(-)